jgi:hypothetical protein
MVGPQGQQRQHRPMGWTAAVQHVAAAVVQLDRSQYV